mmetsp:Transcript_11493/g.34062  ORF Transcript_11493/g.34062 Transcript_11493/m.34062 type:complete len:243 (-) Transcript_11493:13-741(-)
MSLPSLPWRDDVERLRLKGSGGATIIVGTRPPPQRSFCADGDGLDGDRRPKTSGIGPAAGVPPPMGSAIRGTAAPSEDGSEAIGGGIEFLVADCRGDSQGDSRPAEPVRNGDVEAAGAEVMPGAEALAAMLPGVLAPDVSWEAVPATSMPSRSFRSSAWPASRMATRDDRCSSMLVSVPWRPERLARAPCRTSDSLALSSLASATCCRRAADSLRLCTLWPFSVAISASLSASSARTSSRCA